MKKANAAKIMAATGLLLAGSITSAAAHDELVSSYPADGETVAVGIDEITMTYSGNIMDVDGANQVVVTNAAGENVTEETPDIDNRTVSQDLSPAALEPGTYTVTWRVVSSDGHPIQGTFNYTVGEGQDATPSSSAEASSPAATSETSAPAQAAETKAASDPVTQAAEGLSLPVKLLILLGGLATLGLVATVLLKARKK
ncbi:copper resistance CopC family protein [Rothia nasimurium]|uniref:copper resistance CopC family protein n=1 Tax=Rothia nasimurium TaxID=85336 RepID=UPI001F28993A|nr:copper resistance CopC family protein [Rothia nasimurium]